LWCRVRVISIDLNADAGESFGAFSMGEDEALLASITSASVAAGLHGGDPSVLRQTIRRARAHGVAVGAHPGLPDLAGFGRREMRLAPGEAEDLVLYQIAAVAGVAAAEGVRLQHVKPHGALYNMAARDSELASAIVRAIVAADRTPLLFAPPGSEMAKAAEAQGIAVACEAFADRAYNTDGSLVGRGMPGALITRPNDVLARVRRMLLDGVVTALDGTDISIRADTICIHSDTPGSGRLAALLVLASKAPDQAPGSRLQAPAEAPLEAWSPGLHVIAQRVERSLIDSRAIRLMIGPAMGLSTPGTLRLSDTDSSSTTTPRAPVMSSQVEPPQEPRSPHRPPQFSWRRCGWWSACPTRAETSLYVRCGR
jgi:UPF0271 protein